MKKTYSIEVDCANCANLMQEAAKKTEGVANAVVNGAGSMIPGDSALIDGEGKLYYFEMSDGNTLEVVLTKEGTVNYAGVISKNIKDKFVTDI